MSFFKNLFASRPKGPLLSGLKVDMHSHLFPALDDGVQHWDQSLFILKQFQDMGYEKLIITPHIMGDFFKNGPETILPKLEELRRQIDENGISLKLHAAAEYYLDEWFCEQLENGKPFMTLGDNYLLVETSYMNKPSNLYEIMFKIKSSGYKPVLAHPERYVYMYDNFKEYEELFERGILFQININSLSGYYSPAAKKIAERLIEMRMIHFFGSDCHGDRHLGPMQKAIRSKYYEQALSYGLLNDRLLHV